MSYSIALLCAHRDRDQIRELWQTLAARLSHGFFLSYRWVDCWLDLIPADQQVKCVVCSRNNIPVLAFFVGIRNQRKGRVLVERTAYLNETGVAALDQLTIEQNDVMGDFTELNYFLDHTPLLKYLGVKELRIHFCTPRLRNSLTKLGEANALFVDEVPSYFVDLAKLRREGKPYELSLSRNRRQQIRRSMRAYEQHGDLALRPARNRDEAKWMLGELAKLHQATWTRRGETGAFANPMFTSFHERLIDRTFDAGEVFVAKIGTPSTPIGYIYGFIHDNQFLFYQSGLNYSLDDNKLKPGFVAHFLLIDYFLGRGFDRYDFLAGVSRYKTSLATGMEPAYQVTLRKQGLATEVLRLKRKVQNLAQQKVLQRRTA